MFLKKPVYQQDICIEETNNGQYISEYFSILLASYKEDLQLDLTDEIIISENCSSESHFIARIDDFVIGGLKLSVRKGLDKDSKLPLEVSPGGLNHAFPSLELEKHSICEITRFAVHSSCRGFGVGFNLIKKAVAHAKNNDYKYVFLSSPFKRLLYYQSVFSRLNIPISFHSNVNIALDPMYDHLKLIVISCDLTRVNFESRHPEKILQDKYFS